MRPRVPPPHPSLPRRLRHLPRFGEHVRRTRLQQRAADAAQVVAMEMRQCEYRAVIPSALACSSTSGLGSAVGLVFDAFVWFVSSFIFWSVCVLSIAAAAFAISALTGYGARFAHKLPEVRSPNSRWHHALSHCALSRMISLCCTSLCVRLT